MILVTLNLSNCCTPNPPPTSEVSMRYENQTLLRIGNILYKMALYRKIADIKSFINTTYVENIENHDLKDEILSVGNFSQESDIVSHLTNVEKGAGVLSHGLQTLASEMSEFDKIMGIVFLGAKQQGHEIARGQQERPDLEYLGIDYGLQSDEIQQRLAKSTDYGLSRISPALRQVDDSANKRYEFFCAAVHVMSADGFYNQKKILVSREDVLRYKSQSFEGPVKWLELVEMRRQSTQRLRELILKIETSLLELRDELAHTQNRHI